MATARAERPASQGTPIPHPYAGIPVGVATGTFAEVTGDRTPTTGQTGVAERVAVSLPARGLPFGRTRKPA